MRVPKLQSSILRAEEIRRDELLEDHQNREFGLQQHAHLATGQAVGAGPVEAHSQHWTFVAAEDSCLLAR